MLTAVMKPLGVRIKELRESQGLSIRGLSRKLETTSAAHLSDIERGRRFPSKELLIELADALDADVDELSRYDSRNTFKDLKQLASLDPALRLKIQQVIDSHVSPAGATARANGHDSGDPAGRKSELAHSAEMIVRLIASGLVELYLHYAKTGEPPHASYSKKLQRGYDRLVATCLLHGRTPPQSVPALIQLCERTFSDWPLPQLPEDVHPLDTLLHNRQPSFFCEEYARSDRDIEAAVSEERFMQKVFAECSALPSDVYTSLREQLVTRPVLTEAEFTLCYNKPPLRVVADLVKDAYEEAPGFLSHKGFFRCCPECGNLLLYSRDKVWLCRDESCDLDRVREDQIQRVLSADDEDNGSVYQLKHSLRRYVAAPGRFELKLRDRLLDLSRGGRRLSVELYPSVDAYDLRVTFPDKEVWAIDVKDWASPYLLAETVKPFRTRPPWDRAFYVFPDRHKKVRRDYLEAFRNRCVYVAGRVEALFDSDIVAAARQKLRGSE
jgi:transcriptional regulator with XRE-family HTH domain